MNDENMTELNERDVYIRITFVFVLGFIICNLFWVLLIYGLVAK